jgi:hypothetical protein
VETGDGFHIVMLVGRRAASERSLEEAAAEIEQRIRRETLARKKKEFITRVTDNTEVKIDRDELQRLTVELQKARQAGAAERSAVTARINGNAHAPPMIGDSGTEKRQP